MIRMTTRNNSGVVYHSPFMGPMTRTRQVPVNVAAFTANEVTAEGYLKPGVPIYKADGANGALVSAPAQRIDGVTFELQKIAASNAGADLAAAGVVQVVIGVGQVVQKQVEEMLGRVLSANELAAFDAAGSHTKLIRP